jgi:hypothetical protein
MSSNDWNNANPPRGADGWVDSEPDSRRRRSVDVAERHRVEPVLSEPDDHPLQRVDRRRTSEQTRAESSNSGQAMAILAHLSIIFGLPVFLIPMLQRNNALALHHAKAAGTIYGIFVLCGLVAFLTCGLAVPLAILCYVPALVGIVKAARGEHAGAWGLGTMGERIFSGVELKQDSD